MNFKKFTLFIAGFFTLVAFLGLSSAAVNFLNTSDSIITSLSSSVEQGNLVTFSFKVQESGNGSLTNLSFTTPVVLSKDSDTISVSSVGGTIPATLDGNSSGVMTLTFSVSSSKPTGTYTGILTLNGTYTGGSPQPPFTIPISLVVSPSPEPDFVNNFCLFENGVSDNPGNLDVRRIDMSVTGFGDDEQWVPFDEIEVEVTVENDGDDDIDNVALEWGLYDTDLDEWVIDVDEEDEFDLRDGDKETIIFTFNLDNDLDLDLEDLDDGSHYILFVRATGDVDNDNNDETCDWNKENVEIIIESDFVTLTDFQIPESVSCGSNLQISADAWNIGDRDQDDVSIVVFVRDLNFQKIYDIKEINSFDNEKMEFSIPIPRDAEEKAYTVSFEVLDEDDDIFTGDFADDDEESRYSILANVKGNCGTSGEDTDKGDVLVSANLESGGRAGEQLVVKSTITNTGDETGTFLINAAEYAAWANSVSLSEETLTIPAGGSESLTFTFDVKDDVSGDQMFNIEVISEKELVANQPVAVLIESKGQGAGLSDIFGGNWYLWLIGLLNLVLIIIIIVVAVKISRRK